MTKQAFVLVGPHVRLDRGGLSAPAPGSVDRLLALCSQWAAEVGWSLTPDLKNADALVVGPGVAHPPLGVPVAVVLGGQGIDGFRWALRHLAFAAQSPAQEARYGSGPDHVGDVRRPPGPGPHPTAILLHGGFWTDSWRRELMDGVAADLTARGWLTWNIEYRRVGAGGGWPATGNDVLAAMDSVAGIDGAAADNLLLVGHSAGAQLALWAAGERPERVDRVVSLAGLCDLDSASRNGVGGGAVGRLLGGEPASVASPIDRLPLGVAVTVAHMTEDAVVPAEQSRRYADAALAAGDDVQLLELPGHNHMSLIEPEVDWAAVAEQLGGRG